MDLALVVSCSVAMVGVVLAVIFLPSTSAPRAAQQSTAGKEPAVIAVT
jgi:hypothetical protein